MLQRPLSTAQVTITKSWIALQPPSWDIVQDSLIPPRRMKNDCHCKGNHQIKNFQWDSFWEYISNLAAEIGYNHVSRAVGSWEFKPHQVHQNSNHRTTAFQLTHLGPMLHQNVVDLWMCSQFVASICLELMQHTSRIPQAALLFFPYLGNTYFSIVVKLRSSVLS